LSSPNSISIPARLASAPSVRDLLNRLADLPAIDAFSAATPSHSCLAALIASHSNLTTVVVCEGLKRQEQVHQDLETWLSLANPQPPTPARPLFFPAWEVLPHDSKLPHVDVISERLESLQSILKPSPSSAESTSPPPALITTTVAALMQATFLPTELQTRTRQLRKGETLDPLDFIEWLEEQGYEPEAQVTQKGEVALRGGIIDVFPPSCQRPLRVEFFGNEIDSMRHFDPVTQISESTIDAANIPPAGELGLLRRAVLGQTHPNSTDTASPSPSQPSAASPRFATLADYLPQNTIFIILEPPLVHQHALEYARQVPNDDPLFVPLPILHQGIRQRGQKVLRLFSAESTPTPLPDYWSPSESPDLTDTPVPQLDLLLQDLELYRPIAERSPDPQIAEHQRRAFLEQIHRWLRQGFLVHVFCNNDGERQRFHESWNEEGFETASANLPQPPSESSGLHSRIAPLSRGFLCDAIKIVVVTDAEIFGRYKVQRPRRLKSAQAVVTRSLAEVSFSELETGDFVVHLQHGIGKYLGLQILPPKRSKGAPVANASLSEDSGQECLVIEFAPSDPQQPAPKLFVPVSESHLVGKYIGAGKARPQLNTLGGSRWSKTKEHAQRAVKDLASDLLAIQAARESQTGHAFSPDTPWQREFEGSFLYQETADQIRAIDAVKKDMESSKPMDRLICGDVGFGKTEIAIRAAFKAVMGGKQVAVLVPTTVLAQQHYNTLRERMADYPVRVDLLSRFRSAKQQRQTLADLASGAVDIVVGTHRVVQQDVDFKDLGLVIIDEEQRFGVVHKERFKQLRRLVEVLTLSATPIPRTLYLALSGARDLSTIETPPQDRLPVETVLAQYDERLIRDAIQRELNREGQVYFLHNRVSTIDAVALKLRALLPHARILVGHGQMDADDLEKVMTQFVNGEADVLLCTTIIESGLDIPNANTIIIDRADRFGLSELYQLRGRVGRYKHQAYAFLLLPRHAGLLSDARKRLSAIKQYSSLGSGFKIAMRDLELRGAGNLLGAQQSGHIAAIGFELYCQLLKQSIASQRGEKVKPRMDVQLRIDFLILSPEPSTTVAAPSPTPKPKGPDIQIHIPRDVATVFDWERDESSPRQDTPAPPPVRPTHAYLPSNYIPEPKHRIELYRKLAQCFDKPSLDAIRHEVRDRFGPIPATVEMLLLTHELKVVAADRGVCVIETKEDRLMLMRNKDWIMLGGKFPRLTKRDPKARIAEIRRFLSAI